MARFLLLFVLLPLLGGIVLAIALTDPEPSVPPAGPPSAADVAAARTAGAALRDALAGETEELRIEVAAVGSAVRLWARMLPELRADARVGDGALGLRLSLPLHLPGGPRWLNLAATVPPFEGGPALDALTLGGVALPPDLSLDLARIGANLALGDRTGDRLFGMVETLRIGDEALVLTLGPKTGGRGGLSRRVVAAIPGGAMPAPEQVAALHDRIRAAIDAGGLPDTGTMLPHLRFALAAAEAEAAAGGDPGESYAAAILALACACGGPEARAIPESLTGAATDRGWQRDCDAVTLGERRDLRQHFLMSAALQALANRGFAVSVGEFKELLDSGQGGTGFDFTDIAANLAGIRLSDRVMALPAGDWPDLGNRIRAESDLLPRLQGLPGRMTETAFAARFGSIDSPAYRAVLDEIEARIDALPLYAARR